MFDRWDMIIGLNIGKQQYYFISSSDRGSA